MWKVEERTEWDRAFHADAAADWKDRSPMEERIVRGTIRSENEAERSRWQVCIPETHCNKDVRYSGAEPWRYRYVSTASRNVIRSATRNQWSSGVMWLLRRAANTRRVIVIVVVIYSNTTLPMRRQMRVNRTLLTETMKRSITNQG